MTIGQLVDATLEQVAGKPLALESVNVTASTVRFHFATPDRRHFEHTLNRSGSDRADVAAMVRGVEHANGPINQEQSTR